MVFAPFLITFREALEAALLIAILLAYLTKTRRPELHKYVWLGSGVAIALSLVIGIAVFIIFGSLEGVSEKLFEGTASLLATIVLTSMIFWMARNSRKIKSEIHEKIDRFVSRKFVYGIAFLAFIVIFREGIETVLFLTALGGLDPVGTLYGAAAGILGVLVLAFLLIKKSVKLPLQKFFKYTSILLIIFAAGLFGYSIHEFIEAGQLSGMDFGILGESAFDINPPDKENIFHEKGTLGSIFRSLVGYDGNPEWLRVIGYLGYWLVIGLYVRRSFKGDMSEPGISRSRV